MVKEPIFLNPVFKDYIWGGKRLKEIFKKDTPYEITAESWEVSTNNDGKSIVSNGEFKGLDLKEVFDREERIEIFGTKTRNFSKFPILIKFIDAENNLSVQVHPDNKYAFERENGDEGKTEMWYIMDAKEDAQIICGMKENVRQEDLDNILRLENIEEYLEFIDVKKGDVIYIPSGTIHAILAGTLICEVQQNSNLTYRVYDWGRVDSGGKPRQLHVEKAIDVIVASNHPELKSTNEIKDVEEIIVSSEYFKTNKINVDGVYKDKSSKETFYAMNVVNGNGKLISNGKEYTLNLGSSFIIPSNFGEYTIEGKLELLKSYI